MSNLPKVAYLGPPGTFSQAAVLRHFGEAVAFIPCTTIEDAFAEVEQGRADYAVVPVENSTEGVVNNTQDCLVDTSAVIVAEVIVAIEHHLLVRADSGSDPVKVIASHRQSLAQCRKWLQANYPDSEIRECLSNAEAAQLASQQPGVAAIAGQLAAETYGLDCKARGIQDHGHNSTRFLVIARTPVAATGSDKTTALIYAANRPGALFHVLEPFEKLQISLSKIDSRPAKKAAWEYVFFIDFEGHRDDDKIRELFARLQKCTEEIKVVGSYPVFQQQTD